MEQQFVKISFVSSDKSFTLWVTQAGYCKYYNKVYCGTREECNVLMEAFVRIGFVDKTDAGSVYGEDANLAVREANTFTHPELRFLGEPKVREQLYIDFDYESDCWGIFGLDSGRCYSLHASKEEAIRKLDTYGWNA